MKNQIIKEIRSKETFLTSSERRWIIKKGDTGNIWEHYNAYGNEWTTVHLVKETKRGFTFSVYFAGKYTDHFISRSDIEIVYSL